MKKEILKILKKIRAKRSNGNVKMEVGLDSDMIDKIVFELTKFFKEEKWLS